MPVFGISINILSLFAFIMVLGIVVDDAIVIGESAYSEIESKGGGVDNVIRGAKRVATPATFGVLTTIAVFAPFTLSSGPEGAFFYNIAVVVILCLAFSLVESKLILPAHLTHTNFKPIHPKSWRAKFNKGFFWLCERALQAHAYQSDWMALGSIDDIHRLVYGELRAN